jgi:hypothetical protein
MQQNAAVFNENLMQTEKLARGTFLMNWQHQKDSESAHRPFQQ